MKAEARTQRRGFGQIDRLRLQQSRLARRTAARFLKPNADVHLLGANHLLQIFDHAGLRSSAPGPATFCGVAAFFAFRPRRAGENLRAPL